MKLPKAVDASKIARRPIRVHEFKRVLITGTGGKVIFHLKNGEYCIDVKEITTSAELLDWILQLRTKGWCDADLIWNFLQAMDYVVENYFPNQTVQGVFCAGGREHKVQWPKR